MFVVDQGENKIHEQQSTHDNLDVDLIPFSVALVGRIQRTSKTDHLLLVLFDSGSKTSWFNRKAVPLGVNGQTCTMIEGTTMAGTFKSNQALWLEDIHFPEFDKHKTLDGMSARIFNAECRYDIIFGRDVLRRNHL